MQPMGAKIRRARVRQALTLEELAQRAGISKAYLSLIETGRVANPPSDEKLRRIEQALGFPANELVGQAHVQRTPRDVRVVLQRLVKQRTRSGGPGSDLGPWPDAAGGGTAGAEAAGGKSGGPAAGGPLNLDEAYLSGVLQELADRYGGNIEPIGRGPAAGGPATAHPVSRGRPATGLAAPAWDDPAAADSSVPTGRGPVPVVNRVSAGYPSDFTDLSYPPRNADAYITAPGVDDPDAFAARVFGDSMSPKYAQGDIVVFSPAAAWKDGADCFVRFDDGQTTFKRAFAERDALGREVIRLQPRNDRYRPQVVLRERVLGAYRAVSCYRNVED